MADSPDTDLAEHFPDREAYDFAWSQPEILSVEAHVFEAWTKSIASSVTVDRWMTLLRRPTQITFGIRGTGNLETQEWDRRVLIMLTRLTSTRAEFGACVIDPHRQSDTIASLEVEDICRELDLPYNSDGLKQITEALGRIKQAEIVCKIIIGTEQDHDGRIPKPSGQLYYGTGKGPRTPKDRFWKGREYDALSTKERMYSGYETHTVEPSGRINGPLTISWSRYIGSLAAAIAL